MSVLSFAADTDWYITPQLIARKFYVDDVDKIYQFYDQYCNTHSAKFNIFNDVLSGAEHLSQDYIKSHVDKSDCVIGLIDDENTVGILWVKSVNNLAIEVYCQVLDSIVSEDSLVDVLSWFVDYSFYQLYVSHLLLYVIDDKNFDATLLSLGFKKDAALDKVSGIAHPLSMLHFCYHLFENEWINHQYYVPKQKFDTVKVDDYIQNTVAPYFKSCVSVNMCATIVDYKYETIFATNESAKSIGLHSWEQLVGASYKYYARIDTAVWYFGEWYNSQTKFHIHRYARKIFRIQQYVLKTGLPASFIDSLPYDKGIRSYLVTFIPVFDNIGNVIAIQSVALNHRLASYQEHVAHILTKNIPPVMNNNIKLSNRENEVLFLLICGITQEQIAQILHITRATVAAIIRNQLSIKFGVSASNTKLIIEAALALGFPLSIPSSLWAPSVIALDVALTSWLMHYA